MIRVRKSLLVVLFVTSTLACNLAGSTLPASPQGPVPPQAPPPAATSQQQPSLPVPSATQPPTPTETATPAPTDTSVPPTLDPASATMAAMMGSMGSIGSIAAYFQPVGTPVKVWHNVPIMPQATAGQEFNPRIYSYVAAATLDQAHQYYGSRASALGFVMGPGTGTSGSGSGASHNVDFVSYNLTIILTSFDNDTGHVIVVLSVYP